MNSRRSTRKHPRRISLVWPEAITFHVKSAGRSSPTGPKRRTRPSGLGPVALDSWQRLLRRIGGSPGSAGVGSQAHRVWPEHGVITVAGGASGGSSLDHLVGTGEQ